ncbi:MAG: carbohydrate binding family 9 domain-containing protein [Burkholderiales bacterium]|nr:carbohydrate binding family 9 domain-containing protein [Burkholderiales bacterium]
MALSHMTNILHFMRAQRDKKTMAKRTLTALRLASLLSIFCASNVVLAEEKLIIPRANKAPVLADYVHGLPAEHGVEVGNFRQFIPGDGTPSSRDTKAYLSYDDTHFYAVFVDKVDPKLVRANISKRDNIMGDDEVMLELDTFHDKQRTLVFHINPYGVQLDGKRTEGQGFDFNFDTQWQSDGQLTEDGFVAMMAIPFKSLRFQSSDVQTWGIAVGRIVGGINEWSFWPTISNQNASFVGQLADITIPAKLTPGRNLQLIPSLSIGNKKFLEVADPSAPVWQRENKTRPGLDAKWVVGEAMALDLTVNPDFSEVESDEPQAIVNKRYEVLFPEKRPFFLENADFFKTPQTLFFSRRIAEPKIGARLTGREGLWSYGGLVMDDSAPGKRLESNELNYGRKANIAVGRLQNDFSSGSHAGVLLTEHHFGNTSDTVASSDMLLELDKNWSFNAQLAHSARTDVNNLKQNANLSYAELKHAGRNFNYTGKYLDIGANFDTVLAFLPRTDIRQTEHEVRYMWELPETSFVHQIAPEFRGIVTRDHHNVVQDWMFVSELEVRTRHTINFNLVNTNSYEYYAGKGFQKNGNGFVVDSQLLKWLNFIFIAGSDTMINYTPAAKQDASLNNARNLALILGFKPHSQFRLDETLFYNQLRSKDAMYGQAEDSLIYRDLLFRSKLSYQHNRFLGLRIIFDYHQLQANPLLTGIKAGKQLNKDMQVSYVLSPGTTLYAGYADRQENLALIGNPQRLANTDKLDLVTGRSVYVKLNYLFQL